MKTKFKQILVTTLVMIFVLCTLTACSTTSEKKIVGKWYNSSGDCLDIRSDGTYKLENDYGTGSWKILDDGKTIEFKDFYGSVTETKVDKDKNGNYIGLGNIGKFYNIKDIKQKQALTNGISVVINKASCFSEDRALIEYTDLNKDEYVAMIDTNGNILYETKYVVGKGPNLQTNCETRTPLGYGPTPFSGVACIGNDIINKSGKVISSVNTGKFTSIFSWGDGLVLTRDDHHDINGSQNIYKILNEKGDIIHENEFLSETQYGVEAISYAGCGIFQFLIRESDDRYSSRILLLFNVYSGEKKILPISSEIKFVNNIALYEKDNIYFSIDTEFKEKSIGKGDYTTGGYLVSLGTYLSITNPKTKESFELNKYSAEQILSVEIKNGKGLILIRGKSGGFYFTVIDLEKDNKMFFEPIEYDWSDPYIFFSGDKICYKNTNDGNQYSVVDVNGKEISQFELDINIAIYEFNNDIIVGNYKYKIENQDGYCYLNLDGNKLFEMIYK